MDDFSEKNGFLTCRGGLGLPGSSDPLYYGMAHALLRHLLHQLI
jgi:hypothetical protein